MTSKDHDPVPIPKTPLAPPSPPPPPPPETGPSRRERSSATYEDPPPPPETAPAPPPPPPPEYDEAAVVAERELMAALGLPVNFASTKGKQVAGADVSGARIVKRRKYRQYMNRKGGFNRPLDGA